MNATNETSENLIDTDTGKPAGIKLWPETLTDGSVVWDVWVGKYLVIHCINEAAGMRLIEELNAALQKAGCL